VAAVTIEANGAISRLRDRSAAAAHRKEQSDALGGSRCDAKPTLSETALAACAESSELPLSDVCDAPGVGAWTARTRRRTDHTRGGSAPLLNGIDESLSAFAALRDVRQRFVVCCAFAIPRGVTSRHRGLRRIDATIRTLAHDLEKNSVS